RIEGMVTAPALSRLLRKSEGWVIDRWKKGKIPADEVVDLGGTNQIPYFAVERVPQIRQQYGLQEVTEDTLYDDFVRFLSAMDMTFSYKPVWFLALLRCADVSGRASVHEVNREFHQFYLARASGGEMVERPTAKMARPAELTQAEVQQVINQSPFHRFARLDFVGYARDRAFYEVNRSVWTQLRKPENRARAEELCRAGISTYYEALQERRPRRPA